MTSTPNRSTEIASYLAAVERHLNDLPTHIRQDLMSELDTHLSEVAADLEPGMALRDLLGSPESYARELRETAEVEKERAGIRFRRSLRTTAAPVLSRAKSAADRFAASTGNTDAAELAARLRPGWWVLRGAIAAMLFVYWLAAAQFGVSGYSFFGSIPGLLFGVAVLLVCVWLSLKAGAKAPEWGRRRRRWTAAAGIALVALAAYQFSWIIVGGVPTQYVEADTSSDPYEYIDDVRVYDENGEPLTDVYLFDQNGDPLWIGDPDSCGDQSWRDPFAGETDADEFGETADPFEDGNVDSSEFGYQYPLCAPGEEPTTAPTEDDTAPTEGPAGTETPTDAGTASESPAPSDAATPSEDAPTTK